MTNFVAPGWYRLLGRILTPLFRCAGSPRVGPWPTTPHGPTWIHAASLGELKGVLRLLDALPPKHPVHLTSTTQAGLDLLKRQHPHHAISLLPLDSPSVAAKFLAAIQPSSAIFFESEAWPCLLAQLHAKDIPVAFAAFRTCPASLLRWKRFSRLFHGWTKSATTVWTDGASPLEPVLAMGFVEVRRGCSLKWAGFSAIEPAADSSLCAAMSIHSRDLPEIVRMLRSDRKRGWLLFPRRLWLRHPLRWLVKLAGSRTTDAPTPGAGETWIAPRFGLARELLGSCEWVWVSEGHDTEEPHMLGAREVWTGSPPRRVEPPATTADQMRMEIVNWMLSKRSDRDTSTG